MKEASIGVLLNKNSEVLLIKRRDVPVWVLPGGGIEQEERPEEACLRELFEETGVTGKIVRQVGTWHAINRLGATTHVFLCKSVADIQKPLLPQKESIEVRFFPVDQLPKLTFFLHKEWLKIALENRPTPVLAKMTQLTYCTCIKLLLQHPLLSLRYLLSRIGCPINA